MIELTKTAIVTALILVPVAGCDSDASDEPSTQETPILLALPEGQPVEMFAGVTGRLSINEQGCVALGDEPAVVEAGSRIQQDSGKWVVRFAEQDVAIGEEFDGAGGSVNVAKLDVSELADCLDPGGRTAFLLRPSG